jgi:hypothetical protein
MSAPLHVLGRLGNDPSVVGGVGFGSGGAAGMNEKTYPLFLVEAPKAEGVVVCYHCIGKGSIACVN